MDILSIIDDIIIGNINEQWVIDNSLSHSDKSLKDRAYYAIKSACRKKSIKKHVQNLLGDDFNNSLYDAIHSIENPVICSHGKTMRFDSQKLYILCGQSGCLCKKEIKQSSALKMKETMILRYGADNAQRVPSIKEKTIATNLEKYGETTPSKNKEVSTKIKDTHLSLDRDIILANTKETNMLKYGFDNPMKNPTVQQKQVNTCFEKYGVANPSQSELIRTKIKKTVSDVYGKIHVSQRHICNDNLAILHDKQKMKELLESNSYYHAAETLGVDFSTVSAYAKKYGILRKSTGIENFISSILEENNIIFNKNDRGVISPYELDFYAPNNKIAIEVNGLYWHSSAKVSDTYHINKMKMCQKENIRLLMFNEDEINYRPQAVRNMIMGHFGKANKGVGARLLAISKIDNKTSNMFCDKYHLQGRSQASVAAYGAYDGATLVGVMTFCSQRITKHLELSRFCVGDSRHAGMFSKMFKYAVDDMGCDHVITFSDNRYATGNVYQVCGFSKTKLVPHDYKYIHNKKLYHKSTFKKQNLIEKYDADPTLSEREITEKLGIWRIYDCGKVKYEWGVSS